MINFNINQVSEDLKIDNDRALVCWIKDTRNIR